MDTESATCIAMCVDYAINLQPSLPFAALRVLSPIQIAYGAWYRAERRLGSAGGKDVDRDRQHAEAMKGWMNELTDHILEI